MEKNALTFLINTKEEFHEEGIGHGLYVALDHGQ